MARSGPYSGPPSADVPKLSGCWPCPISVTQSGRFGWDDCYGRRRWRQPGANTRRWPMFDAVGVLILALFAVAFGFLTTRAWRLKQARLKWPGVVFSGLLTLILTALLALALVGFYKLNRQHNNPVADVHFTGLAAQVARGQQLAHICA